MEWNEDKQNEWIKENKRCLTHDCISFPEECDTVHPNIAKNVVATPPDSRLRMQPHPQKWRKWLQSPKVVVSYMNQHLMKMECFNMSEAFAQMSTSAKLNVMNNMFENLLDEDEQSLFLADLLETKNDS